MDTNPVADAIERMGGLTAATVQTGVSSTTLTRWRLKGWIDDAHVLLQVAKLTGMDPAELAKPSRRMA